MAAKSLALPLLAFAFIAWVVYLAGLAASQAYCTDGTTGSSGADISEQAVQGVNTAGTSGVFGFSNTLLCNNIYRFYWFIAAFEFVLVVGALVAASMAGALAMTRGFWVGMFAIATVLYMIASEAFLAGISSPANSSGRNLAAYRTTAAGAIITVVANIGALFAVGSDWSRRGHYAADKGVPGSAMAPGATTTTTTGPMAV